MEIYSNAQVIYAQVNKISLKSESIHIYLPSQHTQIGENSEKNSNNNNNNRQARETFNQYENL